MKLLLTSSGISNTGIHRTLEELLGKPIAESSALFIPTAIYPFPGGARMAWNAMSGSAANSLCGLGWGFADVQLDQARSLSALALAP